MYSFLILEKKDIPWDDLEACYDSTPYKTSFWYDFLSRSQNVAPYIIAIYKHDILFGYFCGERIRKFGILIVASPFEGWTTSYQGLSMLCEVSNEERITIYKELSQFLFKKGACCFFQVLDWQLDLSSVGNRINYEKVFGFQLDLSQSIDDLFKKFKAKSCQYSIHKAQRMGVIVKNPDNNAVFAKQYYNQLLDVFAKQRMKPTYSIQRVLDLVNSLCKSNHLLLLEADVGENCIATALFVYDMNLAVFWGAASFREYQKYCPNELLMYEAIKELQMRGCKTLEFGGGRSYKEKYGPVPFYRPQIIISKYPFLINIKNVMRSIYYGTRQLIADKGLWLKK